ncbi:MAG: hypothetical protein U1F57_00775 [bacterium]
MNRRIRLVFSAFFCFVLTFGVLTCGAGVGFIHAADSKVQEKDLKGSSDSISSSSSIESPPKEQKGGIYKVGRAFKKAGRGIKKGFVATGHAFKKVGSTIKNTFTGEKSNPEAPPEKSKEVEAKGSRLDHVGEEAVETKPASSKLKS